MTRLYGLAVLTAVLLGTSQVALADPILYVAHLSGPAESPPTNSPGTGTADITFDLAAHIMRVQAVFSGLTTPSTAAHIHTPTPAPGTGTAGVATLLPAFTDFPLGVTSGTYDHTFDTSQASFYNPAFVTANGGTAASAEAALAAGLAAGEAYFNIHTTNFPGGEIRGFLTAVPEPSCLALMGTAAVVMIAYRGCRAALVRA
jgi:hypothetical protein